MPVLKQYLENFDIKSSRLVLRALNPMWKGSIFSNWNQEQFTSIFQITDVVEIK